MLALNGTGAPIDWLVDMARFDQDLRLDRLAKRGARDLSLMPLPTCIQPSQAQV